MGKSKPLPVKETPKADTGSSKGIWRGGKNPCDPINTTGQSKTGKGTALRYPKKPNQ